MTECLVCSRGSPGHAMSPHEFFGMCALVGFAIRVLIWLGDDKDEKP